MQPYPREHFWNAVIWPTLWPLLLVQAALVALCVLVGVFIWGGAPNQTSWSTPLWLTLALLLGSCMNVAAFLMLLKNKAKREDALFIQELLSLRRNVETLHQAMAPAVGAPPSAEINRQTLSPLQRLEQINELLVDLVRHRYNAPVISPAAEFPQQEQQALLDDLHQQQKQLKYIMAGRDRAREESRLKSGYLTLLQREADKLLAYLEGLMKKDMGQECHQHVSHMQSQLEDIRALLIDFAQKNSEEEGGETLLAGAKQQLKVLVVDDGPVNLMLARQMLEAQGFYVEGVSSGEQALERQQQAFYHLVFMDIFMPTLDGFETARRWRDYERSHGDARSVLIALTANVDNAGREACKTAGLDDVLAKPYQPETLIKMIAKWVANPNQEKLAE